MNRDEMILKYNEKILIAEQQMEEAEKEQDMAMFLKSKDDIRKFSEVIDDFQKLFLFDVSNSVCVYCKKPLKIVDAHIECLIAEKERLTNKQTDC